MNKATAFGLVLTWLVTLCLSGCEQPPRDSTLDQVRQSGQLVVLTRNAPTTYYLHRDRYAGPEHDLMQAFARHLGVQARFVAYDSLEALLDALAAGQGHIAAAGLTFTEGRAREYLVGPPYQKIREQVVCRRNGRRATSVAELADVDLEVAAHSSYVTTLARLRTHHPQLHWRTSDADTESLLEKVWRKQIDCTVGDSNIIAVNRRYHPELVVTFPLTAAQPLVWYLPPDARSLQRALQEWFRQYRREGRLARVLERYYGFVQRFDYVDTRRFLRSVEQRMPRYRKWFVQAGEKYGVRWTLLAAQAYQESHWRPRAKSPTGVRGLMMLTQPTARELGVSNRLDPKQSIFGGARYLSEIRTRLPEAIPEPDRTWFALAAYNIGWAHLRDAMKLAKRLGKHPHRWSDLKSVLPLLSEERYFRTLAYGYARGDEAVRYVNRIRNFEDLIVQRLAAAR